MTSAESENELGAKWPEPRMWVGMTIVHVPSGEVVQEGRAVTLACKGGKEGWWRRYA